MLFWTIVKVGIRSLWASKLRSFLAMLGIIIGVGAVITMLAIAAGARNQILTRISAMGTNLLVITPGQSGSRGVISGSMQNLTLADAEALVSETTGVKAVAPVVSRSAQVKFLNKNTRSSIIGASTTYLPIRGFEMDLGRCFTEQEVDRSTRVAILGPVTAGNLFLTEDPIGQNVKINGINFRVVGILKSKNDYLDDRVIIPYTTAMKQVMGLDHLGEIDVQADDASKLDTVQADVTALLRKRHRTQPGAPEDFQIRNQADMLQTASEFAGIFTLLLGSIAGISLLVGGIGIMNIMLVTVTERTREIGIRKAIGAKERSILLQFLLEAITICGVGGLIGVAAGVGAAKIVAISTSRFPTIVELPSVLLALSFAALVGIFFGWYPARRAAALDPVEALRYE